jgi:hypothetical protein
MFKRVLFSLSIFVLLGFMQAQQKFIVSGYIKDAKNGETIIGATAAKQGTNIGIAANEYGFYSLTLPAGTHTLIFNYIGYTKQFKVIELSKNITLNIEMQDESKVLQEVVISSKKEDENVSSKEMSVVKLDIKTINKIPALLGEVDVIRSIQLLPGVTTVGEGSSGFNVRGGNVDQNLILLDDAPVYNSSHLFGFFSVFNPDAVKDVKLIKGGIPAQYGGRISSVLDIRMKEGNSKKFAVTGGIGTIFSRVSVEGPIWKDKISFIVAARRSYIDILAKPFLKGNLKDSKFNFYDLTAKVNFIINNKNTVFASGYFGKDNFGATAFGFKWGNGTGTLRWNHIFNSRTFFNLTNFVSNYNYNLYFQSNDKTTKFDWTSNIRNYSTRPDFTLFLNEKNTVHIGAQYIYSIVSPGKTITKTPSLTSSLRLTDQFFQEISGYASNEQKLNENVTLEYGVRATVFQYLGKRDYYKFGSSVNANTKPVLDTLNATAGKVIQQYFVPEPRFSIVRTLKNNSSIKASYNRMAQYIHLTSTTAAPTPLDVWTPSTNNIKPQIGDQMAVGYFKNFKDNMYEVSVETYYKILQNQIDYVRNANVLLNGLYEGDILQGNGRAYGAEFFLKKAKGRFTGWISYTLSRTERKVDTISNGQWYKTRFDRPHVLNVIANYELTRRWEIAANFVYQSGTPGTFITDQYGIQNISVPHNALDVRNNFRIPAYHRLDLSATLSFGTQESRKFKSKLVFSIYNAYNRRNAYSVFFRNNEKDPNVNEAVRYSVIGSIVPAVTYNFEF